MDAIHQGRLGTIVDDTSVGVVILFDDDARAAVAFGTSGLVIDPTDAQVVAAHKGRAIPADPAFESEVHDLASRMRDQTRHHSALATGDRPD